MIKAILFDLDGTLIDSPDLIIRCYEEALRVHTNHVPTELEKTNVLGMTLTKAFDKHAKNEKHLEDMIATFRDYSYANTLKMLKPHKNVQNVIQYLRNKEYLVGIVTSKNLENVLENLEQFGLSNSFDCIVTSNDTINHKPDPEPLLYALSKLNVKPEDAIYIGDHENDIKAGNNANMKTGLMGYSYRLNQAMEEKPTYIFSDLDNIKDIF